MEMTGRLNWSVSTSHVCFLFLFCSVWFFVLVLFCFYRAANIEMATLQPWMLSSIRIKPDNVDIDLLPNVLRGIFVVIGITWFLGESLMGSSRDASEWQLHYMPRVISTPSWRADPACHKEQNDHPSVCHGLMCGMIDAWTHVDFLSVLWSFHQSWTAGSRIHLYFQSAQCFCPFVDQSNLFNWEKSNATPCWFFF